MSVKISHFKYLIGLCRVILFRYLSREIYLCLLVITLILVAIFVTNSFSHYLKMVAAGQLTISGAAIFTLLQMSSVLTYLLPLGLFLSILITLSRLYSDNEMTVISACGMSYLRQVMIVMSLAFLVALFAAWLSMWVNPMVKQEMTHVKSDIVNNFKVGTLVPHRFESFGNGKVVYADEVFHGDNKAKEVFLAMRGKDNWNVVVAHEAHQEKRPGIDGKFVVVDRGVRYNGTPGAADFTVSHFKQYGVNESSDLILGKGHDNYHPSHKQQVLGESMGALWHDHGDRYANAEFQLRLAIPISILIASLIAIALAKVDPRHGKFYTLIPAIILYLVYVNFIFIGRTWLQHGTVSPALGLWWVHGIMLCIALALLTYRMRTA